MNRQKNWSSQEDMILADVLSAISDVATGLRRKGETNGNQN